MDPDDERFAPELYDTSDVKFHMPPSRSRKRVVLVADSETDFNLVKYYLALKEFTEKIERELNIMEKTEGTQ